MPPWARVRRSPVEVEPEIVPDESTKLAKPWVTIVWNDPVNLMSYVTFVFQKYFGYAKKKAEKLMLEVHEDGKSVVSAAPARRWSATSRPCTSTDCGRRWTAVRRQ